METDNKTPNSEIEFNSMVEVLKRLNLITYGINSARQYRNFFDMLNAIVDYYKEISGDLDPEELKIWDEIKKVKRFLNPYVEENATFVLNKLDEIDIKLRAMARKHGFLAKTKDDPRLASLKR